MIQIGMGDDDGLGMRSIHQSGDCTIAKDETTSLINGWTRQAVEKDGVNESLPFNEIVGRFVSVSSSAIV